VTADARRYLLTVAVGQGDGRLRVHRLRLTTVGSARGRRIASLHEISRPGTNLFLQG
jgi:hypothetical protein